MNKNTQKGHIIGTLSLLILLLLGILLTFVTSCQKENINSATCDIKTWEQDNYTEWGYNAHGQFHHVLSAFSMEQVDSIAVQDTAFTSITGVAVIIKYGITYIDLNGDLYPIEKRIFYDVATIKYVVENKSYRDIKCYDIYVEIRFDDNTTQEVILNGTDIAHRKFIEDIFYYDTKGKRIIDIIIKDYEFYTNC